MRKLLPIALAVGLSVCATATFADPIYQGEGGAGNSAGMNVPSGDPQSFDITFTGMGCGLNCENGSFTMTINNLGDVQSINGSFSGGGGPDSGSFSLAGNTNGQNETVGDSNAPWGFQYDNLFNPHGNSGSNTYVDLYGILIQGSGHNFLLGNIFYESGEYWLYLDGYFEEISLNVTPVPEPTSIALLGSGLIAAGAAFRRRRRKSAQRNEQRNEI